jgi:hypothetical protein
MEYDGMDKLAHPIDENKTNCNYRTGTQVPLMKTNPAISITSWSLMIIELIMV